MAKKKKEPKFKFDLGDEVKCKITGFVGGIKYLTDKPNGYSLRFDNRRMREVLGEWNFVSLEEGLKREVDYFRGLCP